MSSENQLAVLSVDQRNQLELVLMGFDESWRPDRLEKYVQDTLKNVEENLHALALSELVKIDLQRGWAARQGRLLEDYCRRFPALGPPESLDPELILIEFEARRDAEPQLNPGSYEARFPKQFSRLSELFEQMGQSDTGPSKPKSADRKDQASIRTSRVADMRETVSERKSTFSELPVEFGRYRIVRELGSGAMGAVYLAHDTQLDRQVALKTPNFDGVKDEELITRFYREARAAGKLQHRNICPIYDVGEIDGRHFITMAFIKGRCLSEFISPIKRPPVKTAAILILRLATALAEAHHHNVIHRDLKPANIMVDLKKEPIVMDFGLARQTDVETRVTQSGMMVGTPAYMSPEQITGNPKDVGPQADIYSLGVIFYELLAGQLPFRGSIAQVVHQITSVEPTPLSQLRADVDPELEAICAWMMAKDRSKRFQSMDEVATALRKYLKTPNVKTDAEVSQKYQRASLISSKPLEFKPADNSQSSSHASTYALQEYFGSENPGDPKRTAVESAPESLKPLRRMASGNKGRDNRRKLIMAASFAGGFLLLLGLLIYFNSGQGELNSGQGGIQPEELDLMPLFQGIRPDGTVHVSARVGSGILRYNSIKLPDCYRLELKLLRNPHPESNRSAAGTTHLEFKVGDHFVEYYLNAEGGNPNLDAYTDNGFVNYNQKSFTERRNDPDSYVRRGVWLRDGVADTVVLEVHSIPQRDFGRIVLIINGKEKFRWEGSLSNFVLQSERFLNQQSRDLIVGQWNGDLTIQSARLTRLEPPVAGPSRTRTESPRTPGGGVSSESAVPIEAPEVLPLYEVNVGNYNTSPWPSQDGLRLYWESLETAMGASRTVTRMASRRSRDSKFGPSRIVAEGRLATLSPDELEIVCLPNDGRKVLHTARRNSLASPFGRLQPLAIPNEPVIPKSPSFSADGLKLVVQSGSPTVNEFLISTRQSLSSDWSPFRQFGRMSERYHQKPLTWPFLSDDGMRIWYGNGGDRETEIWTATRQSADDDEAFVEFKSVMADGKPLVGRAPRYVASTHELFFARPRAGGDGWELAVLKNYFPDGQPEPGYQTLFNGKDLNGWTVVGYNGWNIENRVLVGRGSSADKGWLMSDESYGDFELKLDYLLTPGSNSGIFLRAWPEGAVNGADFSEVQLLDDTATEFQSLPPNRRTGSLFKEIAAFPILRPAPNEWHRLTILVQGHRLQVSIDGRKVTDGQIPQNKQARGHIGLQLYPKEVRFRNIRIKKL